MNLANPNSMAIGWRQFNSVFSNFRQGGWAYSGSGGTSWTFPGVLDGVFRSDPVLFSSDTGAFFYLSLVANFQDDIWRSLNGGQSWTRVAPATGGDNGSRSTTPPAPVTGSSINRSAPAGTTMEAGSSPARRMADRLGWTQSLSRMVLPWERSMWTRTATFSSAE
jgi:hypothetical protein